MGLDVFWQTERGEHLGHCPTLFNPWKYMDHPDELENTCCLRFIDEYGDTTFNQSQLPVLIRELESILPKSKDSAATESLESLIAFVRTAEDHVHTYITFVGD
jgi:hypothetical protein